MTTRAFLLFAMLLSRTAMADGPELVAQSPLEAVPVLELYTSHGCSSCPPADRWLRGFADRPDLWRELIPMAFHVDYWDWIGWKDRFASARYSKRQQSYRSAGAIRSVYTPGFVLRGKEWKGWFGRQEPKLGIGGKVGRLSIRVSPGEVLKARFEPHDSGLAKAYRVHLVVQGFGLSSAIGGGENSGRTLVEDFVVLGMHSSEAKQALEELTWTLPWPELVPAATTRRAVAAWVSADDDPAPVQTVALWLP